MNLNQHLGIRKLSGSNFHDLTKKTAKLTTMQSQLNTMEDGIVSPTKTNGESHVKKLKINTSGTKGKIISRNYQEGQKSMTTNQMSSGEGAGYSQEIISRNAGTGTGNVSKYDSAINDSKKVRLLPPRGQ
jgi:hypothetical protein